MALDNAMEATNPGRGRRCTDVLCLLSFAASWAGMLFIAGSAYLTGDADKLLYGLDYKFDQCSQDNSAAARGLASLEQTVSAVPFADSAESSKQILLGGRNHTLAPRYYMVGPGGLRWPGKVVGICAAECPTVFGWKPSQWVCTGKYYAQSNRPDLSLPGVPEFPEFSESGVRGFVESLQGLLADIAAGEPAAVALEAQLDFLSSFLLFRAADKGQCNDTAATDARECTVCFPTYPSVSFGPAAYCLPDVSWIAKNKGLVTSVLGEAFDLDSIGAESDRLFSVSGVLVLRLVDDMLLSWPVVAGCCAFALVLSFIWALLLRMFVRAIVLLTVVGVSAALVLSGVLLWLMATELRADPLYGSDDKLTASADGALGLLCAAGALLVLYCLLLLRFWHKLFVAASVITEAARALRALPLLFFLPLVPVVVALATLGYFALGTFYILSAAELRLDGSGILQLDFDARLVGSLAYHAFGCLWTSVLFSHLSWAVVAAAAAQWYFARDKAADLGRAPVLTAASRVLLFHLGSVAFGSLIVAAVRYARYAMFILKRTVCKEGRCGLCFKLCACCWERCLLCFERVLMFVTQSAYVMVAIESEPFLSSARHACGYLASAAPGLLMVQLVGGVFLFVGKLFVALVSAGSCAAVLLFAPPYAGLSSVVPQCVVVLVVAYLAASLFMGIFEAVIDSVFLCYCIDDDQQLGFADGHLRTYIKSSVRDRDDGPEGGDEPDAKPPVDDSEPTAKKRNKRGKSGAARTTPMP